MSELRTLTYNVKMNTEGATKGAKNVQITMKTMEQDTKKTEVALTKLAATIGGKVNVSTKVLTNDVKIAAAALRAQTKETNKNQVAHSQLSKEYNLLTSRIGKTADEQEVLNAQYRLGSKATQAQRDDVANLVKTYQSQRNAMNQGQGSMRGFRGQMQNIGFQAQDIAVQMQMGTNAMVIFSQQGSQLAAGFGPTGAIVGAGIAFAGMIGSLLLPNLFDTGKAVKELNEEMKTLANTVGLTSEQSEFMILTEQRQQKEIAKTVKKLKEKRKDLEAKPPKQDFVSRPTGTRDLSAYNHAVALSVKKLKKDQDEYNYKLLENTNFLQKQAKKQKDSEENIKTYTLALKGGVKEQEKWTESNKDTIASLQDQAAVIGLSTAETIAYNKVKAINTLMSQDATDAEILAADAAYNTLLISAVKTENLVKEGKATADLLKLQQQRNTISTRIGDDSGQLAALANKYKEERLLFVGNKKALELLEDDYQKNITNIQGTALEQYMLSVEEGLQDFDALAANSIESFTQGFGDAVASSVMGAESLGDAMKGIFEGVIGGMISFFAEWAAQEAAIFLLKKFFRGEDVAEDVAAEGVKGGNKVAVEVATLAALDVANKISSTTANTSAATTVATQASAMSMMAALNAFASTAAIPIVGPAAAPAAASAATAATAPMATTASTLMFAGVFDKGGNIPQNAFGIMSEYGDELANGVLVKGGQGGTQVTSRTDTARMMNGGSGGGTVFNISGGPNATPEQIARSVARSLKRGGNKQLDNAVFDSTNRGKKNRGKRFGS